MPKAFRAGVNDALAETGLGDLMLAKLERSMSFEEAMTSPVEWDGRTGVS